MKPFEYMYDKALSWAEHRQAPRILSLVSFCEAIFFPIPPDVMLAPMCLSKPACSWRYAVYTVLFSLLGGALGFYLGWFLFESMIQPWLLEIGYGEKLQHISDWFEQYGVWIVFISGFSPIPYKFFTLTAGALHMAFLPFLLASFVGRGARFFLVAGLMKLGGEPMREGLRTYVDRLGWATIILAIVAYLVLR